MLLQNMISNTVYRATPRIIITTRNVNSTL